MWEYKVKALDFVFIICIILIIALTVYIYLASNNFYISLEETFQNNVNLNIEIRRNEQIEYLEDYINNRLGNYQE